MTDRTTRTVKSRFDKTVAAAAIGKALVESGARPWRDREIRYPASTDEVRRLVNIGYRPIGPVGWEALRRGGFLPEGESYLGGRRGDDE